MNMQLSPAQMTQREISQVQFDIAEYLDLVQKLDALIHARADGQTTSRAQIELGAGIWADAEIPDTSSVVMDVGLDVRVEMPLEEAREMALRRVEVLRKRLASLGYSKTALSVP